LDIFSTWKNYGTEGSMIFLEHKQTLRAADMS
jgi:hypothetical protein